ncbi:uncharacterized protein ACR2FA_008373 [Aphomia sociella]
METITDLLQTYSITSFDKNSSHWVDVTYIKHPHSFYVRPTVYKKYMNELQAHESKLDLSEAQLGKIVIYKSKLLNGYVRGQIVKIQVIESCPSFDIHATDYGCLEKSVSFSKLRRPTINSVELPPLVLHCQLAECYPIGSHWDESAIDAMKCYVGSERAKMVIKDKTLDTFIVELMNSCPDDIATLLVKTDYASLGFDIVNVNRFNAPKQEQHYYIYKEMNVGDKLHVRVQSGKTLNEFYVCLVSEFKKFLQDRKDFTLDCKTKKNMLRQEDMVVGEPIAAFSLDQCYYERAIVKEINELQDKYVVQLVDWGKINTIPFDCIKAIPPIYLAHPVLSIYCSVDENQIWKNDLLKYLCPGYEFFITIKEVGDKHNTPNIINISPLTS